MGERATPDTLKAWVPLSVLVFSSGPDAHPPGRVTESIPCPDLRFLEVSVGPAQGYPQGSKDMVRVVLRAPPRSGPCHPGASSGDPSPLDDRWFMAGM